MLNPFLKPTDGAFSKLLEIPICPSIERSTQHLRDLFRALPEHLLPQPRSSTLPDKSLYVLENTTTEHLNKCFVAPAVGLAELADDVSSLTKFIEIVVSFDVICLSITSKTASEINVAPLLCRHVKFLQNLSTTISASTELAIQEASINALTHGNLGLKSAYEEAEDDIEKYHQIVRRRAAMTHLKNKRIDFLLWENASSVFVSVHDQGDGFQPPERRKFDLNTPLPDDRRREKDRRQSGRGLDIIRRFSDDFWISPPGTSIVMEFKK